MSAQQYVVAGFAVPEGLEQLHELLDRVREEHPGLAARDVMAFETAVIEIASNVVEHGADATSWTFTLGVTATELRGALADNGTTFEGDVRTDLPEDPLAESGRGLAMAGSLLDELSYERAGGRNHWHMVRTLRPGDQSR